MVLAAKPYLLYKTSNNIYYAEILLPDSSHANKKSTGCKNRADAERAVMDWIVNRTVPAKLPLNGIMFRALMNPHALLPLLGKT